MKTGACLLWDFEPKVDEVPWVDRIEKTRANSRVRAIYCLYRGTDGSIDMTIHAKADHDRENLAVCAMPEQRVWKSAAWAET